MESGLSNANRFLEQLDGAEEEADGSALGEDEAVGDPEETAPTAEEVEVVQRSESTAGENAPAVSKRTDDEADHDFFTPLRGPETAPKGRAPRHHRTGGQSTLRRVDEREDELAEEHDVLRRRNEELEAQLAAMRAETSSQVNALEERLRVEADARGKAEADLAHVKKVAVSPKQHKESLRMIELLKKELSELEAARAKDEEVYQQKLNDLNSQSQLDYLNSEIHRLNSMMVRFYR